MRRVKIRGMWIDPECVEAIYRSHRTVKAFNDTAQVCLRTRSGGEFIAADGHDTDAVAQLLWPRLDGYRERNEEDL